MTLRKKTILSITIAFCSMIVILLLISRFIMLENLNDLEKDNAYGNVERALSALSFTISDLESTTADWSSWDDTYAFIEDGNTSYIQSNLTDSTFIGLRLNLMLFVNSSGRIVFGKAFDLVDSEEIPVPPDLQSYLSAGNLLVTSSDPASGITGLLLLPESPPLLIASLPILTSNDNGPARGTLICGRYLDSAEVDRLSRLTSLSLATYRVDEIALPVDVSEIYPSLVKDTSILTRPLDGQSIAGYALMKDIYGSPGLILKMDMPRDIYQEGKNAMIYLMLAITVIGAAFGVLALWAAEKQELSRLKKLARSVESIGTSGNISERVSVTGKDEISSLANRINSMLATLQQSEDKLRKLYDEETRLRQALETEMKRRAEFTRVLVHELKTPLTPMLTSSDMLAAELHQEPLLSLAKNINRGANRLNKRIDELLDLAKGEIGTLSLVFSEVAPLPLLQESVAEITPMAARRQQSLVLDLPASLPPIRADEERLRQVVGNLLNNACKFTPQGGKITVRAIENDALLTVEVRDTGPGIAEADREKLFQPFYRGEGNRSQSGLGVGLALCKMLVELHGGQVWVRSRVGEGSTFGFSIPTKPPLSSNENPQQGEIA